jgi:heavy metal sensor kinase
VLYVLLDRTLHGRVDAQLAAVAEIALTSLANDLAEGQDPAGAARATADELASSEQMLAVYTPAGRLLAEAGRDEDITVVLPAVQEIPAGELRLLTVAEVDDDDERHRLGFRRLRVPRQSAPDVDFIVAVGSPLESIEDELASLRTIMFYLGPLSLALAGIGGWFLARRGLSPVAAMADRARQIGAQDLSQRLPVVNPGDELGRLADTFNGLLARLETSLTQQRQFMADASHELRTPVATARTAANVALQRPHRDESDYRETLGIIEQQTARLSRIVDDLFTLARADTGIYPVRHSPLYLDELVEEVARAARVIASTRGIAIEVEAEPSAAFAGDEELLQRLIVNLLDNAVRHAPDGSTVRLTLRRTPGRYAIDIHDRGTGVPEAAQGLIFERFYRVEGAPTPYGHGGAGLGLALARWVARAHKGDVRLAHSNSDGTTFTVELPIVE